MFHFTVAETFIDAPINLISWITDFLVTDQGGNRMLYAATRSGGGVLAFDIDAGMMVVDQITFSVNSALPAPATLDIISFGGHRQLIVSGSNQSTLLTYRIETPGTLGAPVMPVGGPAGVISAQEVVEIGGQTWLYAAMTNSGTVRAYAMAANGTLTLMQELSLSPALQGVNTGALLQMTIGGVRFLVASAPGADLVSLLQIGSNGLLTLRGSLGAQNGLGINAPSALDVVVAHGATYVLVAAGGSSSLSVIEVGADGSFALRDHVVDTLDTRLQGVQAFDSFTHGGRSFVIAGGGDGGLELLEILPGGRLVRLTQLLDSMATAMDGISAISATLRGSEVEIFVAGETAGITRLTLDLSALGQVLAGGPGAETLTGGAIDDLVTGGAGNDLILGDSGDDVLVDGFGVDSLSGGAGADLFVFMADGQSDVITDFQPEIDRIDLSGWGRLYHISDMTFTAMSWGARLQFRGEVLDIHSANGLPLSLAQLTAAGLFDLLHTDLAVPHGAEVVGSAQADFMAANGLGSLTYRGLAGDDTLMGGATVEHFDGGDGRDLVSYDRAPQGLFVDLQTPGGNTGFAAGDSYVGIEHLFGSAFGDTLLGDNAAANLIWGANGNDVIYGRAGADTLYGGEGNDVLLGGQGADRLDGGAGTRDRAQYLDATAAVWADLQAPGANTGFAAGDVYVGIEDLYGSAFGDTLLGNDAAANLIWGANGNDVIYGRAGADTLYGGGDNDVLLGGQGADRLEGGAGNRDRAQYLDATAAVWADLQTPGTNTGFAAGDSYVGIEDLHGSNHSDTLLGDNAAANIVWGANGNDVIYGRAGADTLYGGEGNDVLLGGQGADRLDGGAGARDRAQYLDATAAVWADLQTPGINTGFAAGDSYVGVEDLYGSGFGDTLLGDDASANLIWGDAGNDVIYGRAGADTLQGGVGNDTLHGGSGLDHFVFNTALGAGNVDRMADFSSADDTVRLENAIFTALLSTGALAGAAFTNAAAATTAAHRIVYHQASGQLFYDADGNAGGAQILFATVTAGTAINATDFLVI